MIPVIPCDQCGGAMETIEDEPLGRLYHCTRCMVEKSVFFDKPVVQLDVVPKSPGE